MKKNNKFWLVFCIFIFGLAGIYLTFFLGNTNKYDSKTEAYRIYPNEVEDDEGISYFPIYKFSVGENEYECDSKSGGKAAPKQSKNMVYYDSKNPENCITQYDKSRNTFWGIILILVTVFLCVIVIFKKPASETEESQLQGEPIDPELVQKVDKVIDTARLVYKRVVLGVIIIILLFLIFIDTALFKQTLKAKNYIDATATYVDVKDEYGYIYTFNDKNGNSHEIELSSVITPTDEVKIKYNENNPAEYYEESALLDKAEFAWYIVKIVLVVLLTILFFNKELLSRISLSLSKGRE